MVNKREGKPKQNYSYESLSKYFDMPLHKAAEKIGVSTTYLKRMCRRSGIKGWPYRRLKQLRRKRQQVGELQAHLDQAGWMGEEQQLLLGQSPQASTSAVQLAPGSIVRRIPTASSASGSPVSQTAQRTAPDEPLSSAPVPYALPPQNFAVPYDAPRQPYAPPVVPGPPQRPVLPAAAAVQANPYGPQHAAFPGHLPPSYTQYHAPMQPMYQVAWTAPQSHGQLSPSPHMMPPSLGMPHPGQPAAYPGQPAVHPPATAAPPPHAAVHPPAAAAFPPHSAVPHAAVHPPAATAHPPHAAVHPPAATAHPPHAAVHPPAAAAPPPQATMPSPTYPQGGEPMSSASYAANGHAGGAQRPHTASVSSAASAVSYSFHSHSGSQQ